MVKLKMRYDVWGDAAFLYKNSKEARKKLGELRASHGYVRDPSEPKIRWCVKAFKKAKAGRPLTVKEREYIDSVNCF